MPTVNVSEAMSPGVAPVVAPPAGTTTRADLHLVSWNVAGWKTTLQLIQRFEGGLPTFLTKHHVDILCLQEVKLSAKVLTTDGVKLGAEPPGFESFWACNEGSGAQRQGLNGVATIARQGSVVKADCSPLQDPALDSEGRCLMTDHGPFVVFNVYVPNTSGGGRLPFKVRWLNALRAAMARARVAGKVVILAGDLNLKSRAVDSHWTYRQLAPSRLHELVRSGKELSPETRLAAETVAAEWPGIVTALKAKEHKPFETRNSHSGQTYQRWGVFAKAKTGEVVRLGPPMDSEEFARGSFKLDGCGVEMDGTIVHGFEAESAAYTLHRPGMISMGDLAECLRRLANVEVSPKALKALTEEVGHAPVAPPLHKWLREVFERDGMVDSFAELHPNADERFTCWDQYKNKRYENIGSRIDYVLVDRAFFVQHAKKGSELQVSGKAAPDTPAAALAAATLGGLSTPSSFAGGGMQPLEADEYLAQFRPAPSTGIVYTPPQLSDHVGVSLLLCDLPAVTHAAALAARGAATQRSQPHRSAKRITDFFTKRPSSTELPPAKKAAR